jgi:hypothetical protein
MTYTRALYLAVLITCNMSEAKSNDDQMYSVQVRSVMLSQMGMLVDDPHMVFGVVNIRSDECFSVAPPYGASLVIGDQYRFVPEDSVPKIVRDELLVAYPKCKIVKVSK